MANFGEDVIELGSSDEETEPAPKKKRPLPNAMVHIPNKLPGVTIKPASKKPKINPVSIVNSSIGKGITVTKVSSGNKLSNPFATKNKHNGKPTVRKPTVAPRPGLPILNPALTIRPTLKKIQQVVGALKVVKGINTSPSLLRPLPQGTLPPGITVKRTSQLRAAVKPNMKLNPANIQVKKQYRPAATKRAQPGAMVCVNLDDDDASQSSAGPQWYLRPEEQEKTNKSTGSAETSTELEEQKTSAVKTGKSEEEKGNTVVEKESTDLQEQNNKEPETPDYIEITIEDSPAKPQPKRTCEVAEFAITIDDSPAKGAAKKPSSPCGSDEDTTAGKEKNSKKKLEYPETVEIEIELTPVADSDIQNDHKTDSQVASVFETEIVEIVESPIKPIETFNTSTPKKKLLPKTQLKINDNKSVNVPKPQKKIIEKKTVTPKLQPKFNEKKTITLPPSPEEFHPVYQSFINLCFQLENSEDMRKIVEKKIKAYYKQVPKEYTESEVFTDMVASKVNAMKAVPEKMYLFIKDVVDELNLQRKIAKTQPVKLDTVNEGVLVITSFTLGSNVNPAAYKCEGGTDQPHTVLKNKCFLKSAGLIRYKIITQNNKLSNSFQTISEEDKFLYGEESEFDSKRQRQIRKLEKTLKKLHRAIQKLEEQEVDFDDEEDSVYLLTESEEDTSKDIDQPFEKSELLKSMTENI
ncbi:Death domain-associated protein 6 [Operophtera brumata]|uniref:Death domain-associated protein 6 n=1 Tax=Operophtera brumata TaxID=104452 RepID=A0A0L7K724_OPEBR|nr:Death domain-associated protein 6 [Operophtera brumata]